MKSKNINVFKSLSKDINEYIKSQSHLCVDRKGKNDIVDALLYKLLYTQANTTQEISTIKLNILKKKYKKNISSVSSRQSLAKKENRLDVSFYNNLSKFLSKMIDKYTTQNKYTIRNKYTKRIIAVDGTYPTLLRSMSKDGYKLNKNKGSVTPLVAGLFNVTSNFPIAIDLAKTKDERSAFMHINKNKDEYKDDIFVYDRGYYSKEMIKYMVDNNFKYVFRLKKNSKLIQNDKIDDTIIINGNMIRVVTYEVDNKKYYCATNLYDSQIEEIKSIYHDRWTIEEYYKYIKKYLCMAKMNEQREKDINKTIVAQLIVSQITYLFINMHKSNNDKQHYFKGKTINNENNKDYVLNKNIITEGLFGDFLFKFFNNIRFTKYYLLEFLKTYIKFIKTNLNKKNKHECKRSNYRWYFKQHFENDKKNVT